MMTTIEEVVKVKSRTPVTKYFLDIILVSHTTEVVQD
jgi:hypothetical protein